jgi:hypothetical protein
MRCGTDQVPSRQIAPGHAAARLFVVFKKREFDRMFQIAIKQWAIGLAAVLLLPVGAHADELCRFAGTTDYGGRVAVTTSANARAADGTATVDVVARFSATPMALWHIDYLLQETSSWKSGQLLNLGVNSRYIVDGHVVRQQWDVFDRGRDGLDAYRVQGKRLDDFRRKHPGFVGHWDPVTFGQRWISDYQFAGPERRPDLDLPDSPTGPDVRSPLALAFYWTRRVPRAGETVTVILPGFKQEKSVDLTIASAGSSSDGLQLWQSSLRYPARSSAEASSAKAWVSMDGHLLQLAFTVHGMGRTAHGVIRQEGCDENAEASSAQGGD